MPRVPDGDTPDHKQLHVTDSGRFHSSKNESRVQGRGTTADESDANTEAAAGAEAEGGS